MCYSCLHCHPQIMGDIISSDWYEKVRPQEKNLFRSGNTLTITVIQRKTPLNNGPILDEIWALNSLSKWREVRQPAESGTYGRKFPGKKYKNDAVPNRVLPVLIICSLMCRIDYLKASRFNVLEIVPKSHIVVNLEFYY